MKDLYIVFKLNRDTCAIKVDDIKGIAELDSMVKTDSDQINMVVWEDKALPVVDPIAMVGYNSSKLTSHSRILVVEENEMSFGILIDGVLGVSEIEGKIQQPNIREARYVKGICGDIRVFDANIFMLYDEIVEKMKKISHINLEHLKDEKVDVVRGMRKEGKDRILEDIRLVSINSLIKAKRKKMDNEFVLEMARVYNLSAKLS